MFTKKFKTVLMATTMSLVAAGSVMADYLDTFMWEPTEDRFELPPDPIVQPDGETVTWDGWTPMTLPFSVPLAPGASIFLGLENLYQGDDYIKFITLEYSAVPGVVPVEGPGGTNCGYPQGVLGGGEWGFLGHEYSPTGNSHRIEGIIYPQPSWEWIELINTDFVPRNVTITQFTSNCENIPAPGSLALLGISGLISRGRRRRTA